MAFKISGPLNVPPPADDDEIAANLERYRWAQLWDLFAFGVAGVLLASLFYLVAVTMAAAL